MECGSLFLNLSQLGVKAVTKHVRYYMYTVTRMAAFAVWAYLMFNIEVTFEARCGYVVSGGAFWTHNFGLWLHLRKTLTSKGSDDAFAYEKKEEKKKD